MLYCKKCNLEHKQGKFCTKCGSTLTEQLDKEKRRIISLI